jgi:hypothetical protein
LAIHMLIRSSQNPAESPLPSEEADKAGGELQWPVSVQDLDVEPHRPEHRLYFVPRNQPLAVSLVTTTVQPADLSERRDPPCQDLAVLILLAFEEHCPIRAFDETPTRTARRGSSRLGNVEKKNSSRLEYVANAAEEIVNCGHRVAGVEKVVQAFSNRGDGHALGQFSRQDRPDLEPGTRDAFSGDGNHGRREVDAEDFVARIDEGPRQDAAAASQVDDKAALMSGPAKRFDQDGSGGIGHLTEARVVNVGKIFSIVVAHWCGIPRLSCPSRLGQTGSRLRSLSPGLALVLFGDALFAPRGYGPGLIVPIHDVTAPAIEFSTHSLTTY